MNGFVLKGGAIAAMVLALPACSVQGTYKPAQTKITAIKAFKNGVELAYEPFVDSQYHCPGVNFVVRGNKLIVVFVRNHISINSPVDAAYSWDAKLGYKVFIPFDLAKKLAVHGEFYLLDSNGNAFAKITPADVR